MIYKKKSIFCISLCISIIFLFLSVWYLTPLDSLSSDGQVSYRTSEITEGNVRRVNNVDASGEIVFDETKGYAYVKYMIED